MQQGALCYRLNRTGWVITLALSPRIKDGRYLLAVGGEDQVIQLWELSPVAEVHIANGATAGTSEPQPSAGAHLLHSLQGHSDWIRSVAFSPDGLTLVSGSYDQTVRLWDVATGQERQILAGHTNSVLTVAFSPDGQMVASASRDRTVRLWHVQNGLILRTLLGHTDWVRTVTFSPDGQTLVSGGYDQRLYFWSVITGHLERVAQGYSDPVWSIDFSSDGKSLVSSGTDQVRLWDVASGQLQRTLRGHTRRVRYAAFAPQGASEGQLLASGGYDNTIRLWELPEDTQYDSSAFNLAAPVPSSRVLSGHTDAIQAISFSPDGKLMASGSDDSTVCVWNMSAELRRWPVDGLRYSRLSGHRARVSAVRFSPYGQRLPLLLASASSDQSIRLWAVTPGIATNTPTPPAESTLDSLSDASSGNNIRLMAILQEPVAGNRVVAFRPYNAGVMPLLASGSYDGAIRLWDLTAIINMDKVTASTPDEIDRSTGKQQELTDKIHVWKILQMNAGRVRCLAFSPDGQTLVSGGTDRNIYVWDIASGEMRRKLVGHTDWILSMVFHPHSDPSRQILASSSADATIKFWDLQTGLCLKTLRPPGPYEGMNITDITGISDAQRAALKALGAVENDK